jgi:hypothetical protein
VIIKIQIVRIVGVTCFVALVGSFSVPTASLAQQKTVKQCDEEYKANKAEIQKSGKLKKDFMAECRGISTAPADSHSRTCKARPGRTTRNGQQCNPIFRRGRSEEPLPK